MKIAFCIPTYNEEETIGDLVRELSAEFGEKCLVIVSDGGSTDNTVAEASKANAYVITGSNNIRDALIKAYKHALSSGSFDRFVQMDAGGSHSVSDVFWMMPLSSHFSITIGSRFLSKSEYHGRKWRAFSSRMFAKLCNYIFHEDITDWTSGLRLYDRLAVEALVSRQYVAEMHGWQIETLASLLRYGFSVLQYPVSYHAGRSSFSLKILLEALGVLWRER